MRVDQIIQLVFWTWVGGGFVVAVGWTYLHARYPDTIAEVSFWPAAIWPGALALLLAMVALTGPFALADDIGSKRRTRALSREWEREKAARAAAIEAARAVEGK